MGAVETDHAAPEVLPAPVPAVPDVAPAPVAPSVARHAGAPARRRQRGRLAHAPAPAGHARPGPGGVRHRAQRARRVRRRGQEGPADLQPVDAQSGQLLRRLRCRVRPRRRGAEHQPQGRCPVPGGDHARRLRQRRRGRDQRGDRRRGRHDQQARSGRSARPPSSRGNGRARAARRGRRDELPHQVPDRPSTTPGPTSIRSTRRRSTGRTWAPP